MLRLTAWRLSNVSHDKQASLEQWLANLPPVGEHLLDWTIRLAGESSENGAKIPMSSEPTIPKITGFLTERPAVSTIKGYRSMLSSVFKFCLLEISTSPILKDLTRSFEISAPRPVHRSLSWDLDKVLEYLSGPPFEPVADASFHNKTRKALFLRAMATAKRVVELQALSFSVSHRGDDLVLHYDPFFLTRTESVSNPLPRSVIVQSLMDFVGNLPERDLCPVRAVRYLRQATRSVEFTPSRLLVSPSDHTRSMSKNAMSFSFANWSLRAGLCHLRFHRETMTLV